MRFASPPVGGIVYRSPRSSNTIVCPSGDTSSEIQVPSDVVKSTLRVVFRGSESGRWAARDRDETTGKTARTAATSSLEITGAPGEKSLKAEGVPEQRQGNPPRKDWRQLTNPVPPAIIPGERTRTRDCFEDLGCRPGPSVFLALSHGDPDGSDRRRRRQVGIRHEEFPPSDHQCRTVSGHETEALL